MVVGFSVIAGTPLTNTGPLVMSGGPTSFGTTTPLNGSGGTTYIYGYPPKILRKNGYAYAVSFNVKDGATESIKFKSLTVTAIGKYNLLDEVASPSQAWTAGSNYYVLPHQIRIVEGGFPAIYVQSVNLYAVGTTANGTYTYSGDLEGVNNNASVSSTELCLQFYSDAPVIAYTGDSIMAGHNDTTTWQPFLDSGGISGEISSSIPYCASTNGESQFAYCNYASGSQTFNWVDTVALAYITNDGCSTLWIHCGVNDVSGSRTWAAVLANLNSIRAQWPTNRKMWVSEILPWSAGSDAAALTIRQWNTNLSAWAVTNSCTIAKLHDPFGQIRISTGQLDDLATAFNQGDGVHLSTAGISNYVYMMSTGYLTNGLWIPQTDLDANSLTIGKAIFGP